MTGNGVTLGMIEFQHWIREAPLRGVFIATGFILFCWATAKICEPREKN